jgi:hypothetical protein
MNLVPPALCEDPALRALLWRPAESWTEEEVKDYLGRREPERYSFADPRCEAVTHYRRCGRHGRYQFRCLLVSRHSGGLGAPFWVSFLDLCTLPEAKMQLDAKGWAMRDYFSVYSDGEDAWESDGDSHDEELMERRRQRGRPHELVKAPRRSRRAK